MWSFVAGKVKSDLKFALVASRCCKYRRSFRMHAAAVNTMIWPFINEITFAVVLHPSAPGVEAARGSLYAYRFRQTSDSVGDGRRPLKSVIVPGSRPSLAYFTWKTIQGSRFLPVHVHISLITRGAIIKFRSCVTCVPSPTGVHRYPSN